MTTTITIFAAFIMLTTSSSAMKFSKPSKENVSLHKTNNIIKILNLRTEQLHKIKECISSSTSENDLAKCRILNAKTKNAMTKKILKIQSKTPGASSF